MLDALVFTARRYASAVYAVIIVSVRLSVHLFVTRRYIIPKRLNTESPKQRVIRTAQGLQRGRQIEVG